MDKERLIKLLNLTSSFNDGEALSAFRKANNFIRENDLCWEEIIILFDKNKNQITDKQYVEFAILNMNLKKERVYSEELRDKIRGCNNLIKFLLLLSVILIVIIILK